MVTVLTVLASRGLMAAVLTVVPWEGPHALSSSEVQSQPASPAAGKKGLAAKNGELLGQKKQEEKP